MSSLIVDIQDLSLSFQTRGSEVSILKNVKLQIAAGEIVGLVGESGSGKSVTALAISKLLPDKITRFTSGSINFDGKDILTSDEANVAQLRGKRIGFVFQEPMTALNPTMTIGNQLFHVIRRHSNLSKVDARAKVRKSLKEVLISKPEIVESQYPFQLSGGMRQRVVIAMAMSANPALLIADEPTTALDVTVQAEILSLIERLAKDHGTAVLLISHDLGVIAKTCSRVTVLYAGEVVESGNVIDVLKGPRHPYTQALIRSLPDIANRERSLETIIGEFPDLRNRPDGCIYAPRCPKTFEKCSQSPLLLSINQTHAVACWADSSAGGSI
jgi:oligopeptide/dipeptide ABC transporter ATP-binding protein